MTDDVIFPKTVWEPGGGGVLRFAVIRGRADFQGRLFDPKYFRQGVNLGFN